MRIRVFLMRGVFWCGASVTRAKLYRDYKNRSKIRRIFRKKSKKGGYESGVRYIILTFEV